jgi:WD40 repeat protein
LAVAGRRGVIRVWDSATGERLTDLEGHRRVHALQYAPDGKVLLSAGEERTIRVWNIESGKPVADLPERPGSIFSLMFCGSDLVAAGGSGNVVHVWDLGSRQELCQLVGHTGSVASLAWNAKTGTLLSGGFDCTVRAWQLQGHSKESLSRRNAPQATQR